MALATAKKFLRSLAQPTNPKDQEGVSVWDIDQLEAYQKQYNQGCVKDKEETEKNGKIEEMGEEFMDIDDEDIDLL